MTPTTILFRQAHPLFIVEELPTSQVFMPNSGDEQKMSAYDGDRINAADSYIHYTQTLNKKSHSVWGLSCTEVESEGVSSTLEPVEDFPFHAAIDFTGKTDKESRRIAKRLKVVALKRGCLYRPM